jgi:hypothetical protein
MTRPEQQVEYDLMINSDLRVIKVEIPNGPRLICPNSWDYRTNLKETVFKTRTEITKEHPLLTVTPLDLYPVASQKLWIVKILRQAQP